MGQLDIFNSRISTKVLELFAGSRSIGNQAEQFGMEVFSVDWQPFPGIDLEIDIEQLTPEMIPFVPDVVWASPDCTTRARHAAARPGRRAEKAATNARRFPRNYARKYYDHNTLLPLSNVNLE